MGTYELDTVCPHCGVANNAQTNALGQGVPDDGDASVCWQCEGLAIFVVFANRITVRPCTPEELIELEADDGVAAVRDALSTAMRPSDLDSSRLN